MEKDERKKEPDITNLFKLKILGIDFGQILKDWAGVADLSSLQDPAKAEEIRKRLEEQREKLKEFQENFQKKYGNAFRFDYDIRVGSLMGGKDEFRIGGGKFFENLDQLAKERSQWKQRVKPTRRAVPYKKPEGVSEPPVDIIEDKEHIEVIAEIPGVNEKDIELTISDDKVFLSTEKSERKYKAEIGLPAKVSSELLEREYNNGILRIKLKRSS